MGERGTESGKDHKPGLKLGSPEEQWRYMSVAAHKAIGTFAIYHFNSILALF